MNLLDLGYMYVLAQVLAQDLHFTAVTVLFRQPSASQQNRKIRKQFK